MAKTKAETIVYPVHNGLYVNLTNRCSCACTFCIRQTADGVGQDGEGGENNLWLDHEPSFEEVMAAFDEQDMSRYEEVVFCGYGEPTVRADMLVKTAQYIREHSDMKIRLNTNGLVRMIHPKFDIEQFRGLIDVASISLNAPDAKRYNEVTRPHFGEPAFQAMLDFARDMKNMGVQVKFTVVDVITKDEIDRCQQLADSMGIPLRVREYITDNESYT